MRARWGMRAATSAAAGGDVIGRGAVLGGVAADAGGGGAGELGEQLEAEHDRQLRALGRRYGRRLQLRVQLVEEFRQPLRLVAGRKLKGGVAPDTAAHQLLQGALHGLEVETVYL